MSTVVPQSPPGETQPTRSIRDLALRGTMWTAVGYAAAQLLRFGSNLALTYLLFPEAFAAMVIVNTFIMGLHLFSDVGIVPAIVQNERGDDPAFLNTAWSIQIARGIGLWAVACALALPVATFYADSAFARFGAADATLFLIVASSTACIDGLCSTKLYTLQRHVEVGRAIRIEFGAQLAASLTMVTWALIQPTIWALIGGAIAGEIHRTVSSHRLPGTRNRLHWDPAIARELFAFGKWVFAGTLLTFLAEQSDRLIFGRLIDDHMLGVYHIAVTLALVVPLAIEQVGQTVFFPSFSRMLGSGRDLGAGLTRARGALSSLGGYVVAGMIAAGPPVVSALYAEPFEDAGWMVQWLAIGAWFTVLDSSTSAALLAMGKVRLRAGCHLAKVLAIAALLPAGLALGGLPGALLGLAGAQLVKYAVATWGAARVGLTLWRQDLAMTLQVAASGTGVWWASRALLGPDAAPVALAAVACAAVTALWAPRGLEQWRAIRA